MKSVFTAVIAAFMALAINLEAHAASVKLSEPAYQALKNTKAGRQLLTDTLGLAANSNLAATRALINGLSSTQTAAVVSLLNKFAAESVNSSGQVILSQDRLEALANSLFLNDKKQVLTLTAMVALNTKATVKPKAATAVGQTCNMDAIMEGVDNRVTRAEVASAMKNGFISHGACGQDVQSMASVAKSNLMVMGVYVDKAFMRGEKVTQELFARGLLFAQVGSDQATSEALAAAMKSVEQIANECKYIPKAA